jgi:hypothetical protein
MTSTALDPSLFFRHQQPSSSSVSLDGLVAVQVDDSLISGTADFLAEENAAVNQFQCKPAKDIVDGGEPIAFNGPELGKENGKLLAVDASAIFKHCGNCKRGEFYSSPSAHCIYCFMDKA